MVRCWRQMVESHKELNSLVPFQIFCWLHDTYGMLKNDHETFIMTFVMIMTNEAIMLHIGVKRKCNISKS